MKRLLLVFALAGLCISALPFASTQPTRGALILVGGGQTPDEALIEAMALSNAASPRVLVIPQASSAQDRGLEAIEMWRSRGVDASLLEPLDRSDAHELLESCDLIWFSDGSQRDLMRRLAEQGLVSKITSLYGGGKTIGATAGGAAAIGVIMLAGDGEARNLVSGATETYRGLGLWPTAIVEQHFIQRDRYANLLSAVLKKPRQLGVGIGDDTALVIQGNQLRVLGEGQVVVFDARRAEVKKTPLGELQTGRGLQLHVLIGGDDWTWLE